MARRPLNPLSLTALIVLVLLTLVFSLLFVSASNSVTATLDGSPEDRLRKEPLSKVLSDVTDLRRLEERTREDIELRRREMRRLDGQLAQHRVYYAGNQPVTGTHGETLEANGQTYKAKQSNWLLLRDQLSELNKRLALIVNEHKSPARTAFPSLETQIDARQREQQAVLARSSEMDRTFRDDEERMIALKDELEKKKAAIEKQRLQDYSLRASDINKKEHAIRSLLELELRWVKDLEADATILEVVSSDTVLIDIGAKDRAFPGLRLEVFQLDHGRYLEKGMVEVVSVQDRISTGRIIAQQDGRRRPIAVGDQLGNPVYSPGDPKVFVLAGEFKQYNAENLAAFIRAAGGEVRAIIPPGTQNQRLPSADVDFLVAGERSDKTQDDARQYQILAMDEAQLLKYVQPRFAVE